MRCRDVGSGPRTYIPCLNNTNRSSSSNPTDSQYAITPGWAFSPPSLTRCDTRPLPGRPRIRYAGCMAVAQATPISCVYGSQPQPSTGSMAPSPTFKNIEHLEHLDAFNAGKQATATETSRTRCSRCSRCSNGKDDLLVGLATRCSNWGWDEHLVRQFPRRVVARASGRDGVPLPTAARRAPTALDNSGGGR